MISFLRSRGTFISPSRLLKDDNDDSRASDKGRFMIPPKAISRRTTQYLYLRSRRLYYYHRHSNASRLSGSIQSWTALIPSAGWFP